MTSKWKNGVEITVNLEFDTPEKARLVEKSLRPDNRDIPSGLSIRQYAKRHTLKIIFNSKKEGIETLLATLDEVLAFADASISTLAEV